MSTAIQANPTLGRSALDFGRRASDDPSAIEQLVLAVNREPNPLRQGQLLRELDTLTGGRDFTRVQMQDFKMPNLPSRRDVEQTVRRAGDAIASRAQQTAQRAAEASATKEISRAIADPSTSASAREVLTAFLTGNGPRKFDYAIGSRGLAELLGRHDPGGYFKREVAGAITFIMNREKRPYLQDGDIVTGHTYRNFHQDPASAASGLSDGVHIGDVTGTMSQGWKAVVEGGRIYFTATNKMNLTSYAGGNLLSSIGVRDYIKSPASGPLSPVVMEFKFDIPLPANLARPAER
jgi:hypothetical protein